MQGAAFQKQNCWLDRGQHRLPSIVCQGGPPAPRDLPVLGALTPGLPVVVGLFHAFLGDAGLAFLMDPVCLGPSVVLGVSDRDVPAAIPSSLSQEPRKGFFPAVVVSGPPGPAGWKLGVWAQAEVCDGPGAAVPEAR